jgi:hypothetical protein
VVTLLLPGIGAGVSQNTPTRLGVKHVAKKMPLVIAATGLNNRSRPRERAAKNLPYENASRRLG